MKKTVNVSQTYPRLTVYSEENYRGRSRIYRGNTGLRNLDNILDGVESLRFFQQVPTQHWLCLRGLTFRVDSVSSEATPT